VFVVVENSLDSSHSGDDLELFVTSEVRSSSFEGVFSSRDNVPFLVISSMARPNNDFVVHGVLVASAVNAKSLVLVGSDVSSSPVELESLSVVRSLLPFSHYESSTSSVLVELRREDVA